MTFFENLQNMPDLGTAIDLDGSGRDHAQFLGGIRFFENIDRTAGRRLHALQNGAQIGAILLKNASGGALLASRLARFDETGTGAWDDFLYTQVVGYSSAIRQRNVILVDPWVVSVPNGYGFWGIFYGPAPGMTPSAGDYATAITAGAPILAAAVAANAGRIEGIDTTPADAATAQAQAIAVLGTACEAQAAADTLVDIFWNIPLFW